MSPRRKRTDAPLTIQHKRLAKTTSRPANGSGRAGEDARRRRGLRWNNCAGSGVYRRKYATGTTAGVIREFVRKIIVYDDD